MSSSVSSSRSPLHEGNQVCALSRRAAPCSCLSGPEWAELEEVIEHSLLLWNGDALNPWSALSDHVRPLLSACPS